MSATISDNQRVAEKTPRELQILRIPGQQKGRHTAGDGNSRQYSQ